MKNKLKGFGDQSIAMVSPTQAEMTRVRADMEYKKEEQLNNNHSASSYRRFNNKKRKQVF